ncbi:MAG TPA: glycosyl transferase family 2, partial [Flavobacteriaceae bacterium]|nr:glycosyl transferase family 2 [Flavobacteriaceae bacterium]
KKNAVTQGINTAKYEHLLFTDADCEVKHNNWINEMAFHFSNKKQLILGYGAYEKINKSWLNKLIRFETLLTAIQYFSYAKANLTYMGVGRNIAYTKSLFTKANGFTKHQHIKSGDDDLFVNQMAVKNNVSLCYSENSFTYSKPHTNFKKWIYQKRRHISTANHYKLIHQFLLGLFYISQLLFWLLTFFLLFTSKNLMFIAVIIIIRLSLLYIIYGFSAKKLKETDLVLYLPFLELFLIVIQIRIFIQNIFSKPTNW